MTVTGHTVVSCGNIDRVFHQLTNKSMAWISLTFPSGLAWPLYNCFSSDPLFSPLFPIKSIQLIHSWSTNGLSLSPSRFLHFPFSLSLLFAGKETLNHVTLSCDLWRTGEEREEEEEEERGIREALAAAPFRWPFVSLEQWETQPPSSARPLWMVTRPWPGSCTRATLSSGMVWTRTHHMESSTSTTHPCTTCAATPWHVCSGKTQCIAMQQLWSAVKRAVSHDKLNNN